jgi:RNA polymerase subunit RPABC4/transcription elongation factor Spt4
VTKLRIAACDKCGSTKGVEAPGDIGFCPYCPAPRAASFPWRWVLIIAALGAVTGLLR